MLSFASTSDKEEEISSKRIFLTELPNIPIYQISLPPSRRQYNCLYTKPQPFSIFFSLHFTEDMEFEEPKTVATTEDDDDLPVLSLHALAALKEFITEQTYAVSATAESGEVALVSEDWRLSQFWYDRDTAETVAREVLALCADSDARVACIACPTLFAYLKKIGPNASVQLLEYDERFERYGNDFTFYDYNTPEELPSGLKHAFQVIVADPPYLSKECLEKVSQTISFLAKQGESYTLLLTGDVQRDRAAELLGMHPCAFRPQHSSKLGNEFRLFTNYDPESRLGGWDLEK